MADTALWAAFLSSNPAAALSDLVVEWRDAGLTQSEAEARLHAFLAEVARDPALDDEPIREVLDYVTGFCGPDARLFP